MSLSSAGTSVQGAGMIQQEIAQYGASISTTKRLREGIDKARSDVTAGYANAQGYQQPYYQAGLQSYQNLSSMVNSGALTQAPMNYQAPAEQDYGNYQEQPFNFQEDPGYAFRQQEGQSALQNSAAARGNLLSGATLKALQRYGSNLASQEYQAAYNRYDTNRKYQADQYQNNRNFARDVYTGNRAFGYGQAFDQYNQGAAQKTAQYNQLNQMAGYGQAAGNNLSNMAVGQGNAYANLNLQEGGARAAGWQAAWNAAYNQGGDAIQVGTSMGGKLGGGQSGGGLQSQMGNLNQMGGGEQDMNAMEGGYG